MEESKENYLFKGYSFMCVWGGEGVHIAIKGSMRFFRLGNNSDHFRYVQYASNAYH